MFKLNYLFINILLLFILIILCVLFFSKILILHISVNIPNSRTIKNLKVFIKFNLKNVLVYVDPNFEINFNIRGKQKNHKISFKLKELESKPLELVYTDFFDPTKIVCLVRDYLIDTEKNNKFNLFLILFKNSTEFRRDITDFKQPDLDFKQTGLFFLLGQKERIENIFSDANLIEKLGNNIELLNEVKDFKNQLLNLHENFKKLIITNFEKIKISSNQNKLINSVNNQKNTILNNQKNKILNSKVNNFIKQFLIINIKEQFQVEVEIDIDKDKILKNLSKNFIKNNSDVVNNANINSIINDQKQINKFINIVSNSTSIDDLVVNFIDNSSQILNNILIDNTNLLNTGNNLNVNLDVDKRLKKSLDKLNEIFNEALLDLFSNEDRNEFIEILIINPLIEIINLINGNKKPTDNLNDLCLSYQIKNQKKLCDSQDGSFLKHNFVDCILKNEGIYDTIINNRNIIKLGTKILYILNISLISIICILLIINSINLIKNINLKTKYFRLILNIIFTILISINVIASLISLIITKNMIKKQTNSIVLIENNKEFIYIIFQKVFMIIGFIYILISLFYEKRIIKKKLLNYKSSVKTKKFRTLVI